MLFITRHFSVNFRTKRQIPIAYLAVSEKSKRSNVGQPQNDQRTAAAFLEVTRYFEQNDDEQVTINHLIDVMKQKLADTTHEAYGNTHMKNKLEEHFGERIVLTEINGQPNVVTFRTAANVVLQEYYKQQQQEEDTVEAKIKLVEAAAKLIKEDIKAVKTAHDAYPSCEDFKSKEACIKYLPDTLRVLLEGIFSRREIGVKVASIGQAINASS